jgi:hypothetical protein
MPAIGAAAGPRAISEQTEKLAVEADVGNLI